MTKYNQEDEMKTQGKFSEGGRDWKILTSNHITENVISVVVVLDSVLVFMF